MRDGKALQMSTSHELGQNFARAFNIVYQSEAGQSELCHTTSWGASTRLVGGLIMAHGDDRGLVVPPRLAPIQVVIIAVRDESAVLDACATIDAALRASGIATSIDRGRGSFGRRVTDWEIKGIPLRVEVGPRDLASGVVTVVRRDDGSKRVVAIDELASQAKELLEEMQLALLDDARARRDAATADVTSVDEAIEAAQTGFARIAWDLVGEAGEARLNDLAVSVRCIQRADGSTPDRPDEADLVAIVAKAY